MMVFLSGGVDPLYACMLEPDAVGVGVSATGAKVNDVHVVTGQTMVQLPT